MKIALTRRNLFLFISFGLIITAFNTKDSTAALVLAISGLIAATVAALSEGSKMNRLTLVIMLVVCIIFIVIGLFVI